MRLTLRTLLAYLDDVLEPADSKELGEKIEKSEFASNLVHRVRASIQRLRLGTPPLEGKGMGGDPNSVSEYLDSTLAAADVPEFEKVCLESDAYLAEVAACHQILTLVLGEPAEVNPATRERLYRMISRTVSGRTEASEMATASNAPHAAPIHSGMAKETVANVMGNEITPPPAGASTAPASPTAPPASPVSPRRKREIPDYLRASSRAKWKPLVMTLALAFLLAGAVFMTMNPHWWPGGKEEAPTVAQQEDETPPNPSPTVKPRTPSTETGKPGTSGDVLPPIDSKKSAGGDGTTPKVSPKEKPTVPPKKTPGEEETKSSKKGTETPPSPVNPNPPIPRKEEGTHTDKPTSPITPIVPPKPDVPKSAKPAVLGTPVGRSIPDNEVLAKFNKDAWYRLGTNATLAVGDRLVALPTFRPNMTLVSGVQLTLDSGTSVRMVDLDKNGAPYIQFDYGRAVVATAGKKGTQIGLVLPGGRGVATFNDTDSVLAIEVQGFLNPGTDPIENRPVIISRLYIANGTIQWHYLHDAPITLKTGQVYIFYDDKLVKKISAAKMPTWIYKSTISDIDRLAKAKVRTRLAEKRPLSLTLAEMADDKKVEVRSLAVRCLAYVGDFEPFVSALNDEGQRSSWKKHFNTLRESITHGQETAVQIQNAFEKHRGAAKGDKLFRMLWGYSPDNLSHGEAARLVGYLEHESLDFRVLAFENLHHITGKTLLYQPHRTAMRKGSVQRWRNQLEKGEIVYRTPPRTTPTKP